MTANTAVAARLPHYMWREVFVSWRFISNDLFSTVVPASCFVVAAIRHTRSGPAEAAVTVVGGLLYFWLFIYGSSL
ncbi:MAG TPA: prenyltransferase, partial [Streptomyces sp.]|nr:prenyltransferase [Streptomyces sp.]